MPHSNWSSAAFFCVKRPKNKFYTEGVSILVDGTNNADGNVHIGDIVYNIERGFKSGSILFLRLDKKDETRYEAQLSVKSKHNDKGTWTTSGEKWCENTEGVYRQAMANSCS
jgi:hypothetical protein